MHEKPSLVDFAVEKPGEGIRLLVEAKNATAPSPDWAARFLRNLFVHSHLPPSEYFLLALRDHLYLWRHPGGEAGTPDFQAETASALQPYLVRLQAKLETLSESGFELIVHAWLSDLVAGTLPDSVNRAWLDESGLAESVHGGAIHSSLAA